MLSCEYMRDDYAEWHYDQPECFIKFNRIKRTRCCSCGKLIEHQEECLEFKRMKYTDDDSIKQNIIGDIKDLASWYMCEKCGEIYLNLTDAGYFIQLQVEKYNDYVKQAMEEYREMYPIGGKK